MVIGHWSLVISHWSLVKRLRKVISHWSLVISKEFEIEKGRKGERRQETVRTIKIIRSRYRYGIKNISGWEVNGHWSLVISKEAEAKTKAEKREKRKETEKEFKS